MADEVISLCMSHDSRDILTYISFVLSIILGELLLLHLVQGFVWWVLGSLNQGEAPLLDSISCELERLVNNCLEEITHQQPKEEISLSACQGLTAPIGVHHRGGRIARKVLAVKDVTIPLKTTVTIPTICNSLLTELLG
ncbi:hypothetical protein NA56DRAFT_710863 [Hyaloscypha hepaticicola]|uniref:Uncharacterized protein n=1 Tax=Hyaloscypha hepaticicola TaxID=2082293 RepID=A0A2J6PL06_9HELO|nr:hypothetical protein NA56DRAFT_710863 [Hyaloscypha hepaticicola]